MGIDASAAERHAAKRWAAQQETNRLVQLGMQQEEQDGALRLAQVRHPAHGVKRLRLILGRARAAHSFECDCGHVETVSALEACAVL